jgi:hypothetical protein
VNWILWSVVSETALIIIPEEAELLIADLRDAEDSSTYLITYAAPVTRKMLHFNNLCYYAIPALPTGWRPPTWLTVELGILAGRLYFQFQEYADLCRYLSIQEDRGRYGNHLEETSDEVVASVPSDTDANRKDITPAEEAASEAELPQPQTEFVEPAKAASFCAKPLSFLQEWLAFRRKGQDFTHTPMGYVCQGKGLTENHPFFGRVGNDGLANSDTAFTRRNSQGTRTPDPPAAYGDAADEEENQDMGACDHEDEYFDEDEGEDGLGMEDGDLYTDDEHEQSTRSDGVEELLYDER